MDPSSRRMLAVKVSWVRKNLLAYDLLKDLRERHGVRVIVSDEVH